MSIRRSFAALIASALAASSLGLAVATPAAAVGGLSLNKSAPASVLLGDDIPYELTAKNANGAPPQYNVGFSDVLPAGFEYKTGSAPATVGEPTKTQNGSGQWVLVWKNVTDLQPNSDFSFTFTAVRVLPLPDSLTPSDTNAATVASQTDPRTIPAFNPDGTPKVGTFSDQATDTAVTARDPFVIEKSNDRSPEGELLRGVHQNRTTYTLKVRNNKVVPTTDITVTDFIPADMEFLACGKTDNSAPGFVEYTGAPRLGVPALDPSPCPTPTLVETVSNPSGLPPGVYTKVVWNVGTLAAGGTETIKYVAGIPMQPNTMTWPGQTPATDGPQGANLDNNKGTPTTREGLSERSVENTVKGVGTFTGSPVSTQTVTTTESVQIEDLRMRKKADKQAFVPGGIVTFTFELETSEYVSAKNVVITDTLPDGYCPLGTVNYEPGNVLCDPVTGTGPSVPYSSVTRLPASNWGVLFTPVSLPVNGSLEVSFPARMLPTYRSGVPTVAGDSFRNTVGLRGTTVSIPAVAPTETGDAEVQDDSRYTQTTNQPTIDKQMKPRAAPPTFPDGMQCDPTKAPVYQQSKGIPAADRAFRKGDIICFKLRVNFPDIYTKNAVVTDFVPVGTQFVTGSVQPTGNNTVTVYEEDLTGPLTWKLGVPQGPDRFVTDNEVFEVIFAVKVLQPAGANAPELTGNLMKMRTVNTSGEAQSYRDQEDFELVPPPNLDLDKGVVRTTAPLQTYPPGTDNKPVQQGSTATFQVDLKNEGWPDIPGADYSVRGVQIWDVLPAGITCSAITDYRYIKPGTSTVAALPVTVTTSCTAGVVKWVFPTPDAGNAFSVPVGQTLSVLYDMAIPDPSSVSTNYANTAYVRSYDAFTDIPNTVATYFPKDNIDPSVPKEEQDAPPLTDPSNVFIEGVVMDKTSETSVNEPGNDTPDQATIGEAITYTYSATVPAGSTVYRGELSDALPVGIQLVSINGANLDGGALPSGFTLDTNTGTNPTGRLVFATPYQNTTSNPQKFSVNVTAKVLQSALPCASDPCVVPPVPTARVPKTNTATFVSFTENTGGTAITKTKDRTVDIVQPNPAISKTVAPEQMTAADQELTVTLQIRNSGGTRPPLHGWQARDCLPSPFELVPGSVTTPAGVSQSTDGQGCLVFTGSTTPPPATPTDPLRGSTTYTVVFKIKSTGSLPASQQYENTATLTGSSMAGSVAGERLYTTAGKDTWTSPGAAISKVITPEKATIGERFTSKITSQFDKNLNYYSVGLVDTLPVGVNPASVQLVGITCKNADDTDCSIAGTPLPPSGQKIGWSFGDVLAASQKRTVTIEYTAVVADVGGNVAGVVLTNSAQPYWSQTPVQTPPTTIAGVEALPATTPAVSDSVTVIEPSLSIVKKVDGQDAINATPAQEFVYTLKVSNASGANVSTANDITVTDDIPASIEIVGNPSDGGIVSGSTITWTIDSLAPGGMKELSFTARLKPPATSKQTNTARVAEYYSLDNKLGRKYTGPSDAAEVTAVLPVLNILKEASAPLAYINEPYTWTIKVSNPSGATAYGVDVADIMPPNWAYKAGSAQWVVTGGTAAAKEPTGTPPNITWTDITDLQPGKTLTLTFQGIPGPDVVQSPGVGIGTKHTNRTNATYHVGPPAQGWRTVQTDDAAAYTEIAAADPAIVKFHRTDYPSQWNVAKNEVVPGTEFEWVLRVSNNGPDPSMGLFTVVDTLPDGVQFRGYNNGAGWSCNAVGQQVTCTNPGPVDGIPKDGKLDDLVLTVYVDEAATADQRNTATVSGKTLDINPANNTATDEVKLRPLADLEIVKSRTKPYVVGNQVTYTLAVTNLGPSVSVAPITVEDTLPAGLSIASIDSGAWDCTPQTGETDKITCTLDEDLGPTAQADLIKITVDVLESPGTAEAVNTATVTPTTEDFNKENNTSTVEDPVVSEVQLGIAKKTTGANPVTAGQSTEFTITVTNAGPAKAKNVQVVDQLEAGLRATSATGAGWTCDIGSGTVVTCTRANFPVAASPSDIVIKADVDKAVPGGTTLKNTATVTTTSPQEVTPDPATSTVDVIAKSDLAIVKTHNGGPWTIGKQGTWNVQVTNNGPSDNPGPITVTDTLPQGNEFVSATGDGWTCSANGRVVTCERAAGLQVTQSAAFSIRVNVVNGAAPSVVNPAEVTSPVEDPDPSNNKATDQVPVERAKQTADRLPPDPSVLPARKTKQGQKIRTSVRCRPLKASTAGEASFCKVNRSKNGTVRVKVFGTLPVRVIVTQFARGTDDFKPFKRVRKYIVRP